MIEGFEQADHVVSQFVRASDHRTGTSRHQDRTSGQGGGQIEEDRPEAPAEPVPHHGRPHPSGDGEGQPGAGRTLGDLGQVHERQGPASDPGPVAPQSLERASIPDRTDQADSLTRPFRRRLRRMARPARVDMRLRKPWFLARLRTLG